MLQLGESRAAFTTRRPQKAGSVVTVGVARGELVLSEADYTPPPPQPAVFPNECIPGKEAVADFPYMFDILEDGIVSKNEIKRQKEWKVKRDILGFHNCENLDYDLCLL